MRRFEFVPLRGWRCFFNRLGEKASRKVHFICSNMWKPYLNVIAERAGQALHVLDRFHVMRLLNKAIDEVRRGEVKRPERDGYEPEYRHPTWGGKFLDAWCRRVMRTNLEPMKKAARTLRAHRELLLNWFIAKERLSAGTVEGFNNKAKLTLRKGYRFRSPEIA